MTASFEQDVPKIMSIAWLVQHAWPETIGGVELQVDAIARYMQLKGIQVELWVSTRPRGHVEILPDGRKVIGIGVHEAPKSLWRIKTAMTLWNTIQSLQRPTDADVVFSPDPVLSSAYILRSFSKPIIYCPGGTVTGSFEWNFPNSVADNWAERIKAPLTPGKQSQLAERMCLQRAAGIIAVSEQIRGEMLTIHPGCGGRIRVIHNGYEPFISSLTHAPEDSYDEIVNGDQFVTICVARLHRIKNIQHLIRAWTAVKHPKKRLLLVGDGDQKAALQAMVDECDLGSTVTFLGERRDVANLLNLADVFVLPSLYEACGIAVIEAMGAGLPCITLKSVPGISTVAASDEINVEGQTGYCVHPRNPAELAARLNELANEPQKRKQMGENAQRLVEKEFSWHKTGQAYLDFATDLTRSPLHKELAASPPAAGV